MALVQRRDARLEAVERNSTAICPPRPDPDLPYGMPLDWRSSVWTPAEISTQLVGVTVPSLPSQSAALNHQLHENFQGRVHGSNSLGAAPQPPAFTHTSSWDPPLMRMGAGFDGHRSSWEQSASQGPSSPSSPYEFDPILGRPRTSWDLPRPQIAPELCSNHSYSESYRGGGGYSNNYNDHYNNEPQAWTYKPPQPTPCYNHVPQSVQCEPQPPAQYYAEPQPYYPPPPSHTHGQTTVTSPAMPSPLELHQSPPTEEFSRVDLIRGMKKRIMRESPRIQYLSLELLESVAKNCEKAFSATAATKEKMDQKENKDAEVMENGIIDMKTEEEFVSGDEATLEVGEEPSSGSSKSSLQAVLLLTTDESEEAPVYDVRKQILELADELMACDFVVAKEGEELDVECASVYFNFGGHVLHMGVDMGMVDSAIQQYSFVSHSITRAHPEEYVCMLSTGAGGKENGFDPFKLILGHLFPKVARGGIALKFYALAEVYKDLL